MVGILLVEEISVVSSPLRSVAGGTRTRDLKEAHEGRKFLSDLFFTWLRKMNSNCSSWSFEQFLVLGGCWWWWWSVISEREEEI